MDATLPRPIAPPPRGLPLLGHVLEVWRDPLGLISQAGRDQGAVVPLRFGPFRYFVVNDPDAIHRVLQTNAKNYTKSRNYAGLKLVLGEGLLTSEGEHWRRQRRLTQPAFHHHRLRGFALSMADLSRAFVERWDSEGDEGSFDVHAEMMRLTFRMVGQTLLSTDVEGDAQAIGAALTEAIGWAQDYAEAIVRLPPWVPTPANLRLRRALKTLDALVARIVAERRQSGVDPGDLLGMLMSAVDEGGAGMNDKQLRDEVLTLVLAGHETTANLLTFTWYLLAQHPEAEAKLHAELDAALGGRAPTFEDLPLLSYTEQVIQESLRLFPPAWCFERQAIAADELAGQSIPEGSIIAVSPYTLQRDARYWRNPERFDPERFAPERAEARPRYAFLPFGDGPRVCIGKGFALMEAKIILATLAGAYRIRPTVVGPLPLHAGITLRPRGGLFATRARKRIVEAHVRE